MGENMRQIMSVTRPIDLYTGFEVTSITTSNIFNIILRFKQNLSEDSYETETISLLDKIGD